MFEFAKPEPSLCDTCSKAYILKGGMVGIGNKSYLQRYCNYPLPNSNFGRAISTCGYQECDGYDKKI